LPANSCLCIEGLNYRIKRGEENPILMPGRQEFYDIHAHIQTSAHSSGAGPRM